jgi:L-idonate 5-dehydrogenase
MKAIRVYGPMDLRVDNNIDIPVPKSDEVLLKIAYGGICGSDISYWKKGGAGVFTLKDPPMILGHEFSGTIVKLGANVTNFNIGENVTVFPATYEDKNGIAIKKEKLTIKSNLHPYVRYQGSAAVFPHQDGGFVEYKVVDAKKVVPLGANISLKTGAAIEPLSVAMHCINRGLEYVHSVKNKKVFVNGAGAIGGFVIAILNYIGANVDCGDISDFSLNIAKKLGAKNTYNFSKSNKQITEKYDLVIESSGAPVSSNIIFEIAQVAGVVVQVGNLPGSFAEYNLGHIVSKELTYIGSFRFTEFEMDECVKMLNNGLNISALLTDVFMPDDALKAFETSINGKSGKVMIKF